MLSVRFWGVRGSVPSPGPSTVIYGGNTSCLEIRADNRLIIVDLGTGVRQLGEYLMANDFRQGPINADVFVTHTHWDHIIGFPLLTPLFIPTTRLRLWGPISSEGEALESILNAQLAYKFWPIRLSELSAKIEYEQIQETSLDLGGGLVVKTKYLNHPVMCLGYRFEYEGKSIVTAYDHEPFVNIFPTDPENPNYDEDNAMEGELAAKEENARMLEFYRNADILIHDTQYTVDEYRAGKIGWGHSTYEYTIEAACQADVKKLALFHHDPNSNDDLLDSRETEYRARLQAKFPNSGLLGRAERSRLPALFMAKEGLTLHA
jgi:phosphoribosyl 1,2-cyclic phosphodiesterase